MAAVVLFRDMGLGEALEAAAREGRRFVLADFQAAWCGPCKKLDETTWRDERVRGWLSAEAVCVKIDGDLHRDLAEKYRIQAYPTILLLEPDGREIDRLVGYRDAATFQEEAREALAGRDSLARARGKVEGESRNDPMLRMRLGDALAEKGQVEEALAEYLWCFDHGLEHGRGFHGVRLSSLLKRIVRLGHKNPAAPSELRDRRDAACRRLEGESASFKTAMEFAALNTALDEAKRTVEFLD